MVSKFKAALGSGKFVVTCEIAPPKGTNLENSTDEFVTFSPRVQIMLTKELNPSDEE